MSRIHDLKAWPEYFWAVARKDKPFELRRDDRRFEVSDVLHLQQWDPESETYTGNELWVPVCYVLRGPSQFGLPEGYAILGLRLEQVCVAYGVAR